MLALGYADLPAIDASLNFLAATMMICGIVAARRGNIAAHKKFMCAALGFVVIFLGCYLTLHFGPVPPMKFEGEGTSKILYGIFLASHVILAAINAPLVLITAIHGAKGRAEKHRRLARWTIPVWLYVSITGVVIYLILYHFQ